MGNNQTVCCAAKAGSYPRYSTVTGSDGMPQVVMEEIETDSSIDYDSCVYDSEGNLVEDRNTAQSQDNFNVLNEKQFEFCRFRNNPPLSIQFIRGEAKAMEALFTEVDKEAIEEDEDEEEPYHEALKNYQVMFTYQVEENTSKDRVDIKESK